MLIPVTFAFLVAALVAALASRAALATSHCRELAELEAEMTDAIEVRYEAYLELESKVRRILARLDELDAETAAGLARTGVRLNALGRAFAACDGSAGPDGSEDGAEQDPAASLAVEAPRFEPASGAPQSVDIAHWQERLESLAAQKQSELERQERLIAELVGRLESLQSKLHEGDAAPAPASASASASGETQVQAEVDAEVDAEAEADASASSSSVPLAHEVQIWRARHLALEQETALQVAATRARAAAADELEAELAQSQQRLEELAGELDRNLRLHAESSAAYELRLSESEAREAEGFARHAGEVQAYEARIGELEPLVEREQELRIQIESLRATCEQQRLRQEELGAEFERQRRGLEGELAATRTARDAEKRANELRIGELEEKAAELVDMRARLSELECRMEEREEELAALQRTHEEAERRQAELSEDKRRLTDELREAERRHGAAQEAQAEHAARLRELTEQFELLEEISAGLRSAAEEHLGRIAELEDQERRLERSLAERNGELGSTTKRLQDAERTLQAAYDLLAQADQRVAEPGSPAR